ncbi:MAG TPA: hypothetical protein VKE22_28065 [Haliangiales bacterium]|nr:hypothetical protein [Haliangiales bacterium]
MGPATTTFERQKAPCGRIGDGEHVQENDDDGLVTDDYYYACGCRIIHHELHDGSVCSKVVRHDGKVLQDELVAEH